jgi:hypothetical protein
MPDANQRSFHVLSEMVNHEKEVAGMVCPGCCKKVSRVLVNPRDETICSVDLRSFPRSFSLITPDCPWCATSAIHMLLI